jgi:hypothetical protein
MLLNKKDGSRHFYGELHAFELAIKKNTFPTIDL